MLILQNSWRKFAFLMEVFAVVTLVSVGSAARAEEPEARLDFRSFEVDPGATQIVAVSSVRSGVVILNPGKHALSYLAVNREPSKSIGPYLITETDLKPFELIPAGNGVAVLTGAPPEEVRVEVLTLKGDEDIEIADRSVTEFPRLPPFARISMLGDGVVILSSPITSEIRARDVVGKAERYPVLKLGSPAQVLGDDETGTLFASMAREPALVVGSIGASVLAGPVWRPAGTPRVAKGEPAPLKISIRKRGQSTEIFALDFNLNTVNVLVYQAKTRRTFRMISAFDSGYRPNISHTKSDPLPTGDFDVELAARSSHFLLWSKRSREYSILTVDGRLVRGHRGPPLPFVPADAALSADGTTAFFLDQRGTQVVAVLGLSELIGRGNAELIKIQEFLIENGYGDDVVVDGVYGDALREAVSRFQRDAGLKVDGIVGPETLGEIEKR